MLHFVAHLRDLDEVVADHTMHFTSIDQEEELGLNSGIEVEFKFRSGVGVNADVVESLLLIYELFVVFLNLGTHRIPTGSEVE